MFSSRNKKNIMWIPPLICSYVQCQWTKCTYLNGEYVKKEVKQVRPVTKMYGTHKNKGTPALLYLLFHSLVLATSTSNKIMVNVLKFANIMEYANSVDQNLTTLKEQFDQGLHCLPFH